MCLMGCPKPHQSLPMAEGDCAQTFKAEFAHVLQVKNGLEANLKDLCNELN